VGPDGLSKGGPAVVAARERPMARPERGFISIDSEWLVVRFDTAGKVSEYRIVRD
jgi:hypothetical protein